MCHKLRDLKRLDAEHGWIVGTTTLYRTVDGGGHWKALGETSPVVRGARSSRTGRCLRDGSEFAGAPVSAFTSLELAAEMAAKYGPGEWYAALELPVDARVDVGRERPRGEAHPGIYGETAASLLG